LESLRKTNRILRTLSECSRILIRARDELELMKEVCRIVVAFGRYRLAWVGFAEDNPQKKVRPIAHWGYEEGYLEGLDLTWADTERGRGPTGTAIRNGAPSVFQNIFSNPDYGAWRKEALKRGYASAAALPLKEEGKPFGALSVCAAEPDAFDQDELRLLEELADDLAFGIINLRVRTERKQLRNALHQARKMEAIGTLAGGIAHDFNNILGAIITCSEIALEELPSDHPVHDDIDTILKAGLRGKALVKQILTFSRSDGQERQAVQIHALIKECLKLFRATLPSTIEIRHCLPDATGRVRADPTQIHQVVMNLFTNAAQAIGAHAGVLEVQLEPVTINAEAATEALNIPGGPYFRLTVKDSGHGMTPDVQERVFDPFFTTRKKSGGTGLGLSVVYGIVKRNGGAISVDSTPGSGTAFHVFLPRIDPEDAPTSPPQTGSVKGGSERIMLVDDDPELRYAAVKMLEEMGYKVRTATNGSEALAVFRRDPGRFDLVITDQTMPRMKGTELATHILNIRPGTPLILYSGYQTDPQRLQTAVLAGDLGIRFVLQKPFTRAEIAGTIRAALADAAEKPVR
jgi:signal transduction histidine kinase/ActR/RegA family two-component response regulator